MGRTLGLAAGAGLLCALATAGIAYPALAQPAHVPLLAQAAPSPAPTTPAMRRIVTGSVRDAETRPVAGARVAAARAATTTGADGRFVLTLPATVGRSVSLTVSAPGFKPASLDPVPVRAANEAPAPAGGLEVAIVLQRETLTTIGVTSTQSGEAAMNVQPGAFSVIGRERIDDRDEPQLAPLFDETPGVISNHTASSNPASPGVQTSPNLRGTLDYEKTTLIDGHAVATGRFGDYVTTFLSTYVLQDVEIAKGPSAFAPLVVDGIGGTVNFRTLDPTRRPAHDFGFVEDSFGGTLVHAAASATVGKLGFVVSAASYGTPGAFTQMPTTIALPSGTAIAGVGTIGGTTSATPPPGTPAGPFPIAGAQNNPSNAYVKLTGCCENVSSWFQGRSELAKIRYDFSPATSLTAAYLGSQSRFDLDGAQLQAFDATFAPSGRAVLLNPTTHLPANQTEIENEPLFEAELRTALRDDTIIVRWYDVSLNRFTGNATPNAATPYTGTLTLTGTAPLAGGGSATFAGRPESVSIANVFARTVEEDRVHGGSFAYDHPAGNNDYELAVDRIVSLTDAYSEGAANGVATFSASVPAGSRQTITSLMARGTFRPDALDTLVVAGYATTYDSRFSTGPNGTGWNFGNATHAQIDPRVGFTHRLPKSDAILRFDAGGSVTPPAFNVLSGVNQTAAAAYRPGATSLTITQNTGFLKPETSFGYDLGADWKPNAGTVLSGDLYLTNVFDQLVATVTPAGTYTPPGGSPIPLYVSGSANAGNSRFYGLELSARSDPRAGFGFIAQGALARAFAYDVSPALYANAAGPYATNLAIVPGTNYTSTGTGFNGISNKGIPYAQGYGELHYRTGRGALALFGMTYYGNNNPFGVPGFAIANASLRVPLGVARESAAVQVSADNLFGYDGGRTILTDQGIPVALVNGKVGLVNALPVEPRTFRFELRFGGTR